MTGTEKPTYGANNGSKTYNSEEVTDDTFLSSPNPEIVPQLQVGTIMYLHVINDNILVAKTKGEIAGSITSAIQVKIIQWIRNRYEFQATVVSIDGGKCQIHITPR